MGCASLWPSLQAAVRRILIVPVCPLQRIIVGFRLQEHAFKEITALFLVAM